MVPGARGAEELCTPQARFLPHGIPPWRVYAQQFLQYAWPRQPRALSGTYADMTHHMYSEEPQK